MNYYYIQPLGDGKTGMNKSKLLAQLQSSGEGKYRQLKSAMIVEQAGGRAEAQRQSD